MSCTKLYNNSPTISTYTYILDKNTDTGQNCCHTNDREKMIKKKTSGVPPHYEFPRSRKEVLSSLNLVLEDKETLYQEYDRLQNYTEESVKGDIENAVHEDNKNKNRYRDILPYNWRTVRIPDKDAAPGEEQNKYINASWILFKDFKQKFIASQVTQPRFNRDTI